MPAITPQPSSPAAAGDAVVDLGALPGGDQRLVAEGPDAQRRREFGAVGAAVIFWVALCVLKQYCGWPLTGNARQSPHTARQLRMT